MITCNHSPATWKASLMLVSSVATHEDLARGHAPHIQEGTRVPAGDQQWVQVEHVAPQQGSIGVMRVRLAKILDSNIRQR